MCYPEEENLRLVANKFIRYDRILKYFFSEVSTPISNQKYTVWSSRKTKKLGRKISSSSLSVSMMGFPWVLLACFGLLDNTFEILNNVDDTLAKVLYVIHWIIVVAR